MPNIDIPPDEACSFTLARTRAQLKGMTADLTIIGWLGRWVLLVMLLGGGFLVGGLLGPVLYRLMN